MFGKDKDVNKRKIHVRKSFIGGCLYIGLFVYLAFAQSPLDNRIGCKMDGYVKMMYPLMYSVAMLLPLIWNVFVYFRNDFSILQITRKGSWNTLFWEQEQKCFLFSILYAVVLLGWISIVNGTLPFFNWNQIQSYYFLENNHTALYSSLETFVYIFIICVIRNLISHNILLFFLWKKNSLLYGTLFLCGISCFEIAQYRIRILYRLFSVEYTMWPYMIYKIKMVLGFVIWLDIAILLFFRAIHCKELIGNGKV